MKKYYFNDGTAQQGPFTLEELQAKNITAETPVWYDGLGDWTTAGKLEELQGILVHTPPAFHTATPTPVAEAKPVTPAPAATRATTAPAKPAKKSTAWLSYVLALVVLGGVGFLVYQDMEKNKGAGNTTTQATGVTDSTATATTTEQPSTDQPASTNVTANTDTTGTATTTTETVTTTEQPSTTVPVTTTTTTNPTTVTTTKTTTQPTPAQLKAQKDAALKIAQKKAEDEKKKVQAAQAALAAAAAKEKEYRNNWPRYITFGNLNYNADHDGIDAFNVPVYNGTNAMLDKVTVRVDYLKKDKKVLKSEVLTIYNIPPGSGVNGKAPELRKVNNISVKTYITGITSRKLHFCYPANNGGADPYYCN